MMSLFGAGRPRGSWGAGPVGTLAAHLGALHLPADHEQEDAGARGRHRRGRAEYHPGGARLLRGALVALETDGVARGHASEARDLLRRRAGVGVGVVAVRRRRGGSPRECWESLGGAEGEGGVVRRGGVRSASARAPH